MTTCPDYETITCERQDDVIVVRLDRPEVSNAFSGRSLEELSDVIDLAHREPAGRAMIITATGPVFAAGADVNDSFFRDDRDARVARTRVGYGMLRKLRAARFPLICAINGPCVATGISLAAFCDVRIASSAAKFVFGFARVGVFPDMGGSVILPRLLGTAKALELTFLDEPLTAERALDVGLVSQVVDPQELQSSAMAVATRLARMSPLAVRLTREAMYDLPSLPFDDALDAEAAMLVEHVESSDLREGVAAVREGRAPKFVGH